MGWGDLTNASRHQDTAFKTLNQGYFETGIVIEHLLSLDYFSLGRIGLGVGGWYRYGANAYSDTADNLSLKLTLNFDLL